MSDYNNLLSFLPGYCQGLSKVFTTYPFDVIKIKMQINNKANTFDTLKYLCKNNPKCFFRGINIPLISFPIDRAISYKIYEDLNKLKFNPYQSALCVGLISSIFNVPMQYITTNAINTNKKIYKGTLNIIKNTLKDKKTFFKGYSIDTIRSLSGSTIFLGTYGNIKQNLSESKQNTVISSLSAITITWLLTFPLDTLRVLKQVSNDKIYSIAIKRYKSSGILSFYSGLTPVLLRSIPSTIIGMSIYEEVKILIN